MLLFVTICAKTNIIAGFLSYSSFFVFPNTPITL